MNEPLCNECKEPHPHGWKSIDDQTQTWCFNCSTKVRMRGDQKGSWSLWSGVEDFYKKYEEPPRK